MQQESNTLIGILEGTHSFEENLKKTCSGIPDILEWLIVLKLAKNE